MNRHLSTLAMATTLLVFMIAGSATAQDTPNLGGYTLFARGNSIQMFYDLPGSLPIGPLVDVTTTEAQTKLTTGPTGFALASGGHPGPLVIGLSPLLVQGGFPEDAQPVNSGDYPFMVEASSSGTTEADNASAGTTMYAKAEGPVTRAITTTLAQDASPVIRVGGTRTETSSLAGNKAQSKTMIEVSDINIGDGTLVIESVITELTATSDGTTASSSGATKVSGVTFLGQAATIDEEGIHLVEEDGGGDGPILPLDPVTDVLDPAEALAESGIRAYVAAPRSHQTGPAAGRIAQGLTIEFSTELGATPLGEIFDALPLLPDVPNAPIGLNDLVAIMQAFQVSQISIARGEVDVTASPPLPAFELPTFTPPRFDPPAVLPPMSSAPVFNTNPTTPSAQPPASPQVGDQAQPPIVIQDARSAPFSDAPGAGLVVLAAMGAFILTFRLQRLPDWAIDGATAAAACDRPDLTGTTPGATT